MEEGEDLVGGLPYRRQRRQNQIGPEKRSEGGVVAAPLETFTSGYHRLRGNSVWPTAASTFSANHATPEYWLGSHGQWWAPDRSWAVVDRALGKAEIGNFESIDVLFVEVQRMWELLQSSHPYAVWNPYSWKWMVAREVPIPEPGPTPGPGPGAPAPIDPKATRRAQRDARIAEVNAMYSRGKLSRSVRDDRIVIVLDEYSDLN